MRTVHVDFLSLSFDRDRNVFWHVGFMGVMLAVTMWSDVN